MPRHARILLDDQPAVYHVMSRTALDGFPFQAAEKDYLLACIKRFASVYFVDVLGLCLMDNHFHLLVRVHPASSIQHSELVSRYQSVYGEDVPLIANRLEQCLQKWTSLSELMRDVKQTFSRFYNKRHNRRGYLWGDRFKSVIVEDGRALVQCLAYIDLNPIRAGIVQRPEEYRWSSIGYHLQSGNHDGLLDTGFGMQEWNTANEAERLRLYRQFLYETGAVDTGKGAALPAEIVEKAKDENYVYSRRDRFILRTRWFTESGVIGSQEFVNSILGRFVSSTQRRRKPQNIDELAFYALKI